MVPATKDDVLARLSKVVTGNLQTSVGSLTRLMVKTYNDDMAAKGSWRRIGAFATLTMTGEVRER